MGDFGLVPLTPKKDSLILGVSFVCSVVFVSWCKLTYSGIAGSNSPATFSRVMDEYSSSVVALILNLSSVSFELHSSCLLLPENFSLLPNLSFNHWLAILPHLFNSCNSSNSFLWLLSNSISFHERLDLFITFLIYFFHLFSRKTILF